MPIDKERLQPLLWAVVGAWGAGDQDLQVHTDALDEFLGESTVEEVALELLAELELLEAENEALRKDAQRWRFVRSPIGTGSSLAIWQEGRMPLFSAIADAVVDEAMAKEASHG